MKSGTGIHTLLCFDYGEKRIGVAVGQTLTQTASPLETIPVYRNKPDWSRIATLIEQWQPDALLVGYPLQMDDGVQEMTRLAQHFARQLEGRFHLPVLAMDERLSTYEASQRTGETREVDAVAAQAILESWLQENNDTMSPAKTDDP